MQAPIGSTAGRTMRPTAAPGVAPVVLTVCAGVVLSIALFASLRRAEWGQMRAQFELEAREHALAVKRTMEIKMLFLSPSAPSTQARRTSTRRNSAHSWRPRWRV